MHLTTSEQHPCAVALVWFSHFQRIVSALLLSFPSLLRFSSTLADRCLEVRFGSKRSQYGQLRIPIGILPKKGTRSQTLGLRHYTVGTVQCPWRIRCAPSRAIIPGIPSLHFHFRISISYLTAANLALLVFSNLQVFPSTPPFFCPYQLPIY